AVPPLHLPRCRSWQRGRPRDTQHVDTALRRSVSAAHRSSSPQPLEGLGMQRIIASDRRLLSQVIVLLVIVLGWPVASFAATVSWNVDSDGFWDVGSNWSSGMVPQPGQDVVIDRPGASVTVTFRSGTVSVNSLSSTENFAMTGGTLDLATTSTL